MEVRISKSFLPICLCVKLASANGITYLERKYRAASVFGNYFTRICKWGCKTLLIRPLIASASHCLFCGGNGDFWECKSIEDLFCLREAYRGLLLNK